MSHDLVIENARVVDGTGAPWFRGAVGVEDGRIAAVARGSDHGLAGDETVDAGERVVCPGFVDAHSHADLQIFEEPLLRSKLSQGVTTEVLGQDGFSMAPFLDRDPEAFTHYFAGIDGRLGREWTWSTTAEYFDAIDDRGIAPNVAMLVGHGTVRYDVLGLTDDRPTGAELDEMADRVARSLEAGAVGFSTGLEYTPQRFADEAELRHLCEPLQDHGLPFVAHIRSYASDMWAALDEFVDVGAELGIPVHLSHFKLGGPRAGQADRALHLVEASRERDVDFTADLYPYAPGSTMLLGILPAWVHLGGPEEIKERLRDESAREEIRAAMVGGEGTWDFDWDQLLIANVNNPDNEALLGRTVAWAMERRGQDPIDFVCDLLVEGDLEVTMVTGASADGSRASGDDIREVMASDLVVVGSDGIHVEHPHPRVYGTYPRVLGTFVREENRFTMEEAVRKMTSAPARVYGLDRKGVLRPGMDADLVVFDPSTVESPATFEDPTRTARGIPHVLVNGEFVVRDGEFTGATPGGAIRG